ncbi:MAG: PhzF family phenazine biosynthesis protein [Acidobacteria bacterium]|nr:PhzF family phenazine biosynthesis protein [Acidobacteriota bacterium]
MRRLHYHLVDVFTDRAFGGNPLAVITNGRGVDDATMQAVAKEFNLSETTFVLPPDDPRHDWRVRIFTPGSELPMAGHPTVGTAFVLAREHLIPRADSEVNVVFEEGVGPVPVRVEFEHGEPSFAEMSQPLPKFGPRLEDRESVARMLSLEESDIEPELPVELVSCGVPFLYVPVCGLDAARRARPRVDLIEQASREHGIPPEVFVFTLETEGPNSDVHSRMFAPGMGISEDPATGAASGPLGSYLVRYGLVECDSAADIVSEQGIEMGRPSYIRIRIERRGEEITAVKVGGQCHFMGEGFIEIP